VSVLRGTGILASILVVTAIACGLWGESREFTSPWLAAGVAAVVCWIAGALGLASVPWCARRWPATGALAGTLVRMAVPLPIGIALQESGGPLAESHVFSMIMVSYLVMLAADTVLTLTILPPADQATRSANVKSA